jgi:hypothetical protein
MRFVALAVVVALSGAALVACTDSPSVTGPPPATEAPVQLVVLGGDDAFGSALPREQRLRQSWPQLVLGQLPPGSSMVDFASAGATFDDIRDRQVALAGSVPPQLAIVSFDSLSPSDLPTGDAVGEIIDALHRAGATTVLIVSATFASTPDLNAAAAAHGATIVDTSTATESGADRDRQVADAIRTTLVG